MNPDPNGPPWLIGGYIPITAEELAKIPQMVPTVAALSNTLPSSCDNSVFKYMALVKSGNAKTLAFRFKMHYF